MYHMIGIFSGDFSQQQLMLHKEIHAQSIAIM